ncbi:hypothetical protein N7E02_07295 (plasmid) [Aliirhizobium terrae]|uniref:hypothetical protein n=1 Tax=Terrirhizobium terrae TaxID=2926709 RepID=UPI002576B762|nr:hypothetical protein [Rhizobium sp. CC-CFT758]WJH38430.1 hypothetical protein N7E02_07295 [Rhizobium sp. CC-CFT758]
MPSHVERYRDYWVGIYSPGARFAVITAPESNAVLELREAAAAIDGGRRGGRLP